MPLRSVSRAGFTLVEVMITLAILAGALTLIARSQQASMHAVSRARQMTIATQLARQFLVNYEDELLEAGFPEMDEEDDGDFEEEGFPEFFYRIRVEKIEMPTASTAGDELPPEVEEAFSDPSAVTGVVAARQSLVGEQFGMFSSIFEQTIRRVTLEVIWHEGKNERSIDVMTYFTDPSKLDPMAALAALRGEGEGGTESGGTTPGAGR